MHVAPTFAVWSPSWLMAFEHRVWQAKHLDWQGKYSSGNQQKLYRVTIIVLFGSSKKRRLYLEMIGVMSFSWSPQKTSLPRTEGFWKSGRGFWETWPGCPQPPSQLVDQVSQTSSPQHFRRDRHHHCWLWTSMSTIKIYFFRCPSE